jgi:hypothetical protein
MRGEIAEILGNFFGNAIPVLGTFWQGKVTLKTGNQNLLLGWTGVITGDPSGVTCGGHRCNFLNGRSGGRKKRKQIPGNSEDV